MKKLNERVDKLLQKEKKLKKTFDKIKFEKHVILEKILKNGPITVPPEILNTKTRHLFKSNGQAWYVFSGVSYRKSYPYGFIVYGIYDFKRDIVESDYEKHEDGFLSGNISNEVVDKLLDYLLDYGLIK